MILAHLLRLPRQPNRLNKEKTKMTEKETRLSGLEYAAGLILLEDRNNCFEGDDITLLMNNAAQEHKRRVRDFTEEVEKAYRDFIKLLREAEARGLSIEIKEETDSRWPVWINVSEKRE
jgi:hypothetical protein